MVNTGKKTRFLARLILIFVMSVLMVIPDTAGVSAAVTFSAPAEINSSGGAYLRAGPSKSTKRVALLKHRSKVIVSSEHYTSRTDSNVRTRWFYVTAGNKKGYVRADLLKNIAYTPRQAWTTDALNYRYGAGTSMRKKGTLKKGTPVTVVFEGRAYNSKKVWYKIRIDRYYYYVSGDYITWSKPSYATTNTVKPAQTSSSSGSSSSVWQSAASKKVAAGAVSWAIKIANDNSFHYGNGTHAHHNGCYFCGTQPSSKQKYVVQWQKTYCCNPFVHAAYAHGGNESTMLSMCKRGRSFDWNSYRTTNLFKPLGHPSISSLLPGDVLCWDGHVAMYIGNNQLVEAGGYGEDDGRPGSKKWNNSIAVTPLDAKTYRQFTHAYRYVGAN